MRLITVVKKNLVPILFVVVVVALLIYIIQNNKESEQFQNLDSICRLDSYHQTFTSSGNLVSCRDGYESIKDMVKIQPNVVRMMDICVKTGIYKCPVSSRRSGNGCLRNCNANGTVCNSITPICRPA